MNKKMTRIIAIALVALLAFVSILALAADAILANAEGAPELDAYRMSLQVMETLDAVRVDQQLVYTNRTGGPLTQVLFNLYPNAYRRRVSAPFDNAAFENAYPDGFAPGGADFFLVEVNESAADWGVEGEAEAFMRVAATLAPGETCTFRFGYELLIPRCASSFGATDIAYQLLAFYPSVAPWDAHLAEFSVAAAKPARTDLMASPANFSVRIDAPRGTVLGAPGTISARTEGARTLFQVEAQAIRSLALVLGANYGRHTRTSESGVQLVALMQDAGAARRALDVAARALSFFEANLGPYPFETLTIAQVQSVAPVRAGSGVLMLDGALRAWRARGELEYRLAQAIARQWFFEKAACDPAREPWLADATSAYMALRFLGHAHGEPRFLRELDARVLTALKVTLPGGTKVDSQSLEFVSVSDYETVVWQRGSASMYELSLLMGDDALYAAMRRYIDERAGAFGSIEHFAAALSAEAGAEMDRQLLHLLQNITDYANEQMDIYR